MANFLDLTGLRIVLDALSVSLNKLKNPNEILDSSQNEKLSEIVNATRRVENIMNDDKSYFYDGYPECYEFLESQDYSKKKRAALADYLTLDDFFLKESNICNTGLCHSTGLLGIGFWYVQNGEKKGKKLLYGSAKVKNNYLSATDAEDDVYGFSIDGSSIIKAKFL